MELGSDERLERTAFVQNDGADCHFQPEAGSPVRLKPPQGTKVEVLRQQGDWVQIQWLGKEAWILRENLSPHFVEPRKRIYGHIVPAYKPPQYEYVDGKRVHYGPNGGRYVYTDKGYRRYI